MIYVLILLPICFILTFTMIRRRQRENNKPVIVSDHPSQLHPFNAQQASEERKRTADAETDTSDNLATCSILIIDDQSAIRMLLRELFELEGLTVYEAINGAAAIDTVRSTAIDFILLDLKMPDMDGIEALQGIRRWNEHAQVAMITAFGDPLKMEAAKQLGVQSFFTKPFDIERVKCHVLNSLKKQDCKVEHDPLIE
ncbi:response regulator [Paenibacillus sp. CF384]|uniref:response regulator n=1 Tax=Paenibacillus sp. CF384 TaxID=1884382 RepID=UPI000899261D|nr:response regulator [Paenibacillus sp. CF384]SDX78202.1 Response regulator receiver domain-containing protein [Paenibacillus sp. CF384]